jgi:adenine-specific DNA methylase
MGIVQEEIDGDEERKARGAFFTPPALADFVASWAVRSAQDVVLEPSCGDASLLVAAGERLRELGGLGLLRGLDIHAPSIADARTRLKAHRLNADLSVEDFFDLAPTKSYDAIVGNPPYIRYQTFTGLDRAKAQRAALAQGVRLGGLANAWAAFVVHASQFIHERGRMALIIPAALLSVNYAGPVRRFLLNRFKEVKLVLFEDRVFPGVMEEVVLLLAEGKGPTSNFKLYQVKDLAALSELDGLSSTPARRCQPVESDAKWTEALLPTKAATLYSELTQSARFISLADWGDTDLGMVTGNNDYFTLTAADVTGLKLRKTELLRISPAGSRHLRGLTFSEASFDEMEREGAAVYLFNPNKERPSIAAQNYIATGEKRKVHKAYKCAVRTPWWRVPAVRIPDLFLTYMNQDMPRLVSNEAGLAHLNSIHGVTLKKDLRTVGMDLLPLAMLNSVTMLGAELVGRSYGGGILKVEPKEADLLPLPTRAILEKAGDSLRALRPQLGISLRGGKLSDAVAAVDEVLLVKHLGMDVREVRAVRAARDALCQRRSSRSAKAQ